jgi:hypothetical protein
MSEEENEKAAQGNVESDDISLEGFLSSLPLMPVIKLKIEEEKSVFKGAGRRFQPA